MGHSLLFNRIIGCLFSATLLYVLGCGKAQETAKIGNPAAVSSQSVSASSASAPKKKIDLTKAKADYTTDADSWNAEWKDLEVARKKYKGKIVELNAVVDSLDDDADHKVTAMFLKLNTRGIGPCCLFDGPPPWLTVGPGCTIKLRGVVPEFGIAASLYPCIILESSPNTCLQITALQLAKDFATDKKAAEERYDGKWVIVEGELASKELSEPDKGRFMYVILKGEMGVNIRCYLSNNNEAEKKGNNALKVGQTLKICGKVETNLAKEPVVNCQFRKLIVVAK